MPVLLLVVSANPKGVRTILLRLCIVAFVGAKVCVNPIYILGSDEAKDF